MSEKQLITAFTAMRRKFLQIASRMLPRDEEAEDALQEAFCRLWPRRDRINSDTEAEALTTTTLKNICIDRQRKRRLETVPIDEEHDSMEEDTHDEKEALLTEVEKIIEHLLSATQKRIIKEKEYNEKSIEEIATELNMQPTAVRMQLSRARKKIREIYRQREP
jgi:RNA polymerase sigma-70 factor (ECF subfamily)